MDNAEFNRLLLISKNGGRQIIGGEASTLLELLRRKATAFLVKKGQLEHMTAVDDLADAVFVDLLQSDGVPEKYSWRLWILFRLKAAWGIYCRENLSDAVSMERHPAEVFELREKTLPVPVKANAQMMVNEGQRILYERVMEYAPKVEPDYEVWKWTVDMLINAGAVLDEKQVVCKAKMSLDEARQTVLRVVLRTRKVYEEMFGGEGLHDGGECRAAHGLAQKIF